MKDTELYRYLLGIEAPWTVRTVQLDLVNQRVDIWADHAEDLRWPCPECGSFIIKSEPIDERLILGQTVQPRLRVAGLGERRHGADLHEAEAEAGDRSDRNRV